MFSATSDYNPITTTLDTAIERENLNNISKFGLLLSITQNIDSRSILHDIHIDYFKIASNINLNS